MLGLLVTPHDLVDDFWPAVVVGLVLTMVARPVSVFLSLAPFRLPAREKAPHVLAGLRGAVPIILATIPMVSGVEGSTRIFNIVFVLVIVYTLIQGPTLPWVANRLNIAEDPAEADDLGIESAPLERLRGHLLSVAVPTKSKMHGVEVGELRLPAGSRRHAGGPGEPELRALPGDGAAARGRAAGGGHRPGARPGGGTPAGGRRGRQAGRLAGHGRICRRKPRRHGPPGRVGHPQAMKLAKKLGGAGADTRTGVNGSGGGTKTRP